MDTLQTLLGLGWTIVRRDGTLFTVRNGEAVTTVEVETDY